MTDARGIGPNTLRTILDGLGLKLVKTQNLPANVGRSPELALVERVSVKMRDYTAKWNPDISREDWHDDSPYHDVARQAAAAQAIAALDVPQCLRCRGTGYRLVNNAFKTHESCQKCGGSGRLNP